MRTLEIVMRIVCFLIGVMLASGGSVQVPAGLTSEAVTVDGGIKGVWMPKATRIICPVF